MDQPMEGITVVEVKDKIDHMAYLPGMEQIDPTVRAGLRFVTVEGVDQVLAEALELKVAAPAGELAQPHVPAQSAERPSLRQ